MGFLATRNLLMEELGWNRRVATLATRLAMGIDTWDGIDTCYGFDGEPLLYLREKRMIRAIGLETIREEMNHGV